MGQQEENHEAPGPQTKEELDPFEQLATALGNWKPDTSGDKKTISLRSHEIVLQTWQPLEFVVGFLKYHKNPDFAKDFEGEFTQLYKEIGEFYDKLVRDEFSDYESFNLENQELENAAYRLALYVLQVRAMWRNDAGIAPDGFGSDEEGKPPFVCVNLKTRTIRIGSTLYTPTADSIWTFLEDLITSSETSEPTPREGNKEQVDMLRKVVGKDGLRHMVTFARGKYRLSPAVKVRR
jgi:hypothetical protein